MVNTFWMFHRHYAGNGFDWDEATQTAAHNIVQKLVSHWSNLHAMWTNKVRIDGVKVAHVDSSGKTLAEGLENITDNALQGSYSGEAMPPETAWILGLWGYSPGSFVARAGTKRGRMYIGGLSSSLQTNDGLVDQDVSDGYLAAWQSFFNDVQGMHCGTPPPITDPNPNNDYFKVGIVSPTAGTFTQLTQVTGEDQFGSQRRRQNGRTPVRHARSISHAE